MQATRYPALPITSSWTINDVLRSHPIAATVLNTFGIDTCCGGNDTLEFAAFDAKADPRAVLLAIERVCTPANSPTGATAASLAMPVSLGAPACSCRIDAQ